MFSVLPYTFNRVTMFEDETFHAKWNISLALAVLQHERQGLSDGLFDVDDINAVDAFNLKFNAKLIFRTQGLQHRQAIVGFRKRQSIVAIRLRAYSQRPFAGEYAVCVTYQHLHESFQVTRQGITLNIL